MRGFAPGRSAGVFSLSVYSLVAAVSLSAGTQVSAATLVLTDGSVIHGEVETLQDDVYVVESATLGTVRLRKQDIRSIDLGDESAPAAPADAPLGGSSVQPPLGGSPAEQAELQAMQLRVLQDPDLLSMIQALQNDPEVQAVLSDPQVMSAVAAGDFAELMNQPKIIALMNNAKVREIIEEAQ